MENGLYKLLAAWQNQDIDEACCKELLERLRTDDTFRRSFAEELWIHGKLKAVQSSEPRWLKLKETLGCLPYDGGIHDENCFEQEIIKKLQLDVSHDSQKSKKIKKGSTFSALFYGSLAAGLLIIFTLVLPWRKNVQTSHSSFKINNNLVEQSAVKPIQPATVCRIISLKEAVFEGRALSPGDLVAPGHLELTSGWAIFEMDNGANVTLSAPAAMELIDQYTVRMISGKLVGYVPETAASFKVLTPSLDVIDLGTRFGVEVDSSESTKVSVLEGLVQITDSSGNNHLLSENLAIRGHINSNNPLETISFDRSSFNTPSFDKLKHNYKYVHFGFEEESPNILSGTGNGIDGGPFSAVSMVSEESDWIQTNGPFGKAIGFSGSEKSWFQTDFPGISGNQPRTVALWIKIARKDNNLPDIQVKKGGILPLVSWGIPIQAMKWQVVLDAKTVKNRTVLRTEFEGGNVIGSKNIADGRWHHVVSVYLGGNQGSVAQRIRHYIDGQLDDISYIREGVIDTRTNHPESRSLCLGRHLNWDFLNYVGLMDEVYVFDQALTPSQIYKLYLHNHPE